MFYQHPKHWPPTHWFINLFHYVEPINISYSKILHSMWTLSGTLELSFQVIFEQLLVFFNNFVHNIVHNYGDFSFINSNELTECAEQISRVNKVAQKKGAGFRFCTARQSPASFVLKQDQGLPSVRVFTRFGSELGTVLQKLLVTVKECLVKFESFHFRSLFFNKVTRLPLSLEQILVL